jgi:hypothetical protein
MSALPDDPFLEEDGSVDSWSLAMQVGQLLGRALLGLAGEDVGALIAGIRTLERDELQAVVACWLLEGDVLVVEADEDEAAGHDSADRAGENAGEKADDDGR